LKKRRLKPNNKNQHRPMALPRVLILNQPFVSNTGGGITMSNLFSGWDAEKLAVACSGYELTKNIDPGRCNNYYQLGHEERKWIFPLNLVGRKYPSGAIKFTNRTIEKVVSNSSKSKTRMSFVQKYIEPLFDYLGITHFMARTDLSSKFQQWIDEFDPDIIYAQCSSREGILFCIAVQEYLKRPMVYHMMDDWPALFHRKGFMKSYWANKIDSEFRLLLDRTTVHLGISDYMGEEYLMRYGKKFITFHNPIDIEFWKKGQRNNYEIDKSPNVLYAGRIGLGIDSSLQLIAQAIDQVNEELQMSIRFTIQAFEAPTWINDFTCTQHKGFVPYEELPKVFGKADFMILPYDFDSKSLSYIKYSMPTKASEYMASGTPIIIYGPEDTALVQYAKRKEWAAIITEKSAQHLVQKINELVQNKSLREKLALTAKNLAEQSHNIDIVARNFQKVIANTSENRVGGNR